MNLICWAGNVGQWTHESNFPLVSFLLLRSLQYRRKSQVRRSKEGFPGLCQSRRILRKMNHQMMLLYTFSSRHRFYQSELQASLSASTIGSSHDLFWNAGILKVGRWLSRAKPSPQKLRLLVSRRHCEEEERLKKILSQLLLLSRLGLKPKSVLFSVLPQSQPNATLLKKNSGGTHQSAIPDRFL